MNDALPVFFHEHIPEIKKWPWLVSNLLVIQFLMDGLASGVFFKVSCQQNTTQLRLPSIANQSDTWPWTNPHCCHCIATCHWLNHRLTFYQAPRLVSESSPAPALIWCHDRDLSNQNTVMLLVFEGRLVMFTEKNLTPKHSVNMMKKYVNIKRIRHLKILTR